MTSDHISRRFLLSHPALPDNRRLHPLTTRSSTSTLPLQIHTNPTSSSLVAATSPTSPSRHQPYFTVAPPAVTPTAVTTLRPTRSVAPLPFQIHRATPCSDVIASASSSTRSISSPPHAHHPQLLSPRLPRPAALAFSSSPLAAICSLSPTVPPQSPTQTPTSLHNSVQATALSPPICR